MVTPQTVTRFISCDWGTSRLRLRLIEPTPIRILTEHATDEGIQHLARIHPAQPGRREFLATVLERGIAALGVVGQPEIPVVISGMASSTLGWQALPYASLPAPVDGSTLRFVDFVQGGRRVRLVSGLQATNDVMRGEETELIGLLADPSRHHLLENSTVVLPGSHSKHVRLHAGKIVEFATYLTGELYGLLSQNSTLATPDEAIFDEAAFVSGVRAARSLSMSAALFQTRARTLLGHLAAEHSRACLSGVLIGAEVATLTGAPTGKIVLAAGESFARQYALALGELSPDAVVVQISPADLATAVVMGQATILSLP